MGHVVTPNGLSVTFLYIIPYIFIQIWHPTGHLLLFFVLTLSELFQCQVFASTYLPNRNYTIGNGLWTLLGLYSVIMTAQDEACDVMRHKKNLHQKTDAQFNHWRTPRACVTSGAKDKRICSGGFVVCSVDRFCCGSPVGVKFTKSF